MPGQYTLGKRSDDIVQTQLATGRYADTNEVVDNALVLLQTFEQRRADLHAAIKRGLDDADAGRVRDAEEVFDELLAELEALDANSHR
jgi:antitoxin ParD1/3/4